MATYRREAVAEEYERSAESPHEHERVRWGSRDSMINRHAFVLEALPFERVHHWLDVGCGTGYLQAQVMYAHDHLEGLGIDLSPSLIREARARDLPRCTFEVRDFAEVIEGRYDLITCMGVLPKTTIPVSDFFQRCNSLLEPGGWCLADAKNAGWVKFSEPGFEPDPGHQWNTVEEFAEAARCGGAFEIERLVGFIPRENRVVEPDDSHAIYVIARKKGSRA